MLSCSIFVCLFVFGVAPMTKSSKLFPSHLKSESCWWKIHDFAVQVGFWFSRSSFIVCFTLFIKDHANVSFSFSYQEISLQKACFLNSLIVACPKIGKANMRHLY